MRAIVTSEKNVQAACLEWLNTIPAVKAWRVNTGVMASSYTSKRTGETKQRFTRFGEKGQCDISGIGPHGVRIEVEVKKPGAYPSIEQTAWMGFIRNHGGIAFWCDSLESCVQQLRYEFEQRGWIWRKEWEC
jgi:hypothetical protein